MNLQGYCYLKDDANLSHCMGEKNDWINIPIRVLEFNDDSKSCLVIDKTATKMGTIDYDDIISKFNCEEINGILIPRTFGSDDFINKMLAYSKRLNRKGGYNDIVRAMVIQSSLHKGEFNDNFLFQKQ